MRKKPRTIPRDLVLPVPLARRPGAKARGLPPNVPAVRIPLYFYAISKTCWRCRQSRANPSLPISLLNREKTGNFCEFGQFGGFFCGFSSSNQSVSHEFPKNRNREFFRPNSEFSARNREFTIPAFRHTKGSCHRSLAGHN